MTYDNNKSYCAPQSWAKWIRDFVSQDKAFNQACYLHDELYEKMGQKEADDLFYVELKKNIGMIWLNPVRRFKAWRFYLYVRAFGSISHKAAQEKSDG